MISRRQSEDNENMLKSDLRESPNQQVTLITQKSESKLQAQINVRS